MNAIAICSDISAALSTHLISVLQEEVDSLELQARVVMGQAPDNEEDLWEVTVLTEGPFNNGTKVHLQSMAHGAKKLWAREIS